MGTGSARSLLTIYVVITRSKQSWKVGSIVTVGWMKLRVIGLRAIKDGLPDIYDLESINGERRYEFIPHNGLTRVDDRAVNRLNKV